MSLPQHFFKDCRAIFTGRNLKFHVNKPFEDYGAVFKSVVKGEALGVITKEEKG
jgi:hypothetical protein